MDETPLKMVIVDDHFIIRLGLKMLFQQHFSYSIYEASNGDELYEIVKTESPDFILLDINMPGTNSQGVIQSILSLKPSINILIFTVNKEEIYGKVYLKLGAKGFLEKDSPPEELLKAVRYVMAGNIYIRKGRESIYLGTISQPQNSSPYAALSKKELEVFQYLAQGNSLMSIAKVMNLSASTIGTHKANIFSKLKIKSTIELLQFIAVNPLS